MSAHRPRVVRFDARRPERRPEPSRADDLALAGRLQRGDPDAWAELHRLYERRVFAFALKRLRDPTEAEDVAQDVFLQAHRSLGRYEGRSSLLTWLFGIAHHETCNRFRRRRIDAKSFDGEERRIAAAGAPADVRLDMARGLARCAEIVQREVSAAQREVFELRFWQARPVAAIARQTGKSAGAVRIGLLRTRRAIAEGAPEIEGLLAS